MQKIKSFFHRSVLAFLISMMFMGTLCASSAVMQPDGVSGDQRQNAEALDAANSSAGQLTFAPERLKDKNDYGMELESETGARAVSIQRYKPSVKGSVNIFILNTGDIHESSKRRMSIAGKVQEMRALHPGKVILLDAGDMLTHFLRVSPESDWQGKHDWMYSWAESMQYDAMVFGNHDFVASVKSSQQWIAQYHLPYVCANLQHPDLNVSPSKIIPLNFTLSDGSSMTVKIGVIGLADQTWNDFHHPNAADKSNLTVHPVYNNTIKNLIATVETDADFVVLLSHNLDQVDRASVAKLPGGKKHVIVGGHSHGAFSEVTSEKSLIKSGAYGAYLGSTMVEWNPNTKTVANVSAKNFLMNE